MIATGDVLARFGRCGVLVVGDLMLDDYRRGHVGRISPEAPVPILNVVRRDVTLGGAGNVVKNLCSLGVNVALVSVIGCDDAGDEILKQLAELEVGREGVACDPQRVSTRKVRYVSIEHGQQVFRADEETDEEISGQAEENLIAIVREKSADVQVIFCSDYLKGVLTARVLQAAFEAGRTRGIPVIVAPKDKEVRKYNGATILMPNVGELSRLVGTPADGDAWMEDSAARLSRNLCELETLLVTRGSEGMTLFEREAKGMRRVDIPTVARKVYDVTGAGDTALAAFGASVAAGASVELAAHLANIAAGVVVGKRGTAVVTSEEILAHSREEKSAAPSTQVEPEILRALSGR